MTAETLKPFLTPQNGGSFPATHSIPAHRQRSSEASNLGVVFGVTGVVFGALVLGLAIWSLVRVSTLETELRSLKKMVETMQKHLGIHYLEDLNDFEKEYTNALIDDKGTLVDVEPNEDDDEDEEDPYVGEDDEDTEDDLDDYDEIENYDDIRRKYQSYDDDDSNESDDDDDNTSDDDNLYDDFEKFKDSKKKKKPNSRKERSIATGRQELTDNKDSTAISLNRSELPAEVSQLHLRKHHKMPSRLHLEDNGNSKRQFVGQDMDIRRTPLRQRSSRRRKLPVIKSAKSTVITNAASFTPAAHFHLNRKVSDRHAAIRVHSFSGDMYIGQPSWANDAAVEHFFKVENGVLTVREAGLYYIYAQVCYNNTHDQNGFFIFHGHEPFLQCLNTVPTNLPLKIHTCHTSGLIHLRVNETIHLRDIHSDRNAILKETNNRSYFGLIKI